MRGDDELSEWVKSRKEHFIPVSRDEIQDQFSLVAQHVAGLEGKKPVFIADFLAKADPWLVATAAVIGGTVVTHELRVPDNRSKAKIPNVCNAFGLPYITTFQLLNHLDAKFVLGQ